MPFVTADIPSVVSGVDAAVAVEMDGDGEVDDDDDDPEGSNGDPLRCER